MSTASFTHFNPCDYSDPTLNGIGERLGAGSWAGLLHREETLENALYLARQNISKDE